MKMNNYDERQLYNRGKVFRFGFLVAIFMRALRAFATQVLHVEIEEMAAFMFELWTSILATSVGLIVKEAYDGLDKPGGAIVSILGLVGLFIVLEDLLGFMGPKLFVENGVITYDAGSLYVGVCMVVICAVYWIKHLRDRRAGE